MYIEFVARPNDHALFDLSDELSNHNVLRHSPELKRLLRERAVVAVNAEYRGMDGRGRFDSLQFITADGKDCPVFDGPRNLQLKAIFRAMLLARHPGWCQCAGSCGTFRWDIRSDSMTHCHYSQACVIPPSN
jgi:hypothetical protein